MDKANDNSEIIIELDNSVSNKSPSIVTLSVTAIFTTVSKLGIFSPRSICPKKVGEIPTFSANFACVNLFISRSFLFFPLNAYSSHSSPLIYHRYFVSLLKRDISVFILTISVNKYILSS